MRKKGVLCLKLILLIIIFWWIFRSVNLNETVKVLSKTNLFYFTLAFILNNLSNVILTIKWQRLATPLKIKSNFLELLKLNYISIFYSIFVPGQASGELIKGLKLSRKENSYEKVWIPIFIDKITNLLMILIIGFVAILLDQSFRQNPRLIFTISVLTVFCGIITILLFSENTEKFVTALKNTIIKILKLLRINTSIVKDFSLSYFKDYKKHDLLMIETILWSFLIKLPHIFTYYFLALSLNLNLDLIKSAWLFSVVSIASLLPISFSGLGVREGTVLLLFSQLNIQNSFALSFSMLVFITGILSGLIGGSIELLSDLKLKPYPLKPK